MQRVWMLGLSLALAGAATAGPADDLALIDAVRAGDAARVEALLAAGARVDFVRPDPHHLELSVVEHAAHAGQLELVRLLVERGAPLRRDPQRGLLVASFVVRNADALALVQELWERVAREEDPAPHFQATMVEAARQGHVEVLRWLLAQGLDPDWHRRPGTYHRHATVEAARYGHFAAVRALVEAGADPDPPVHDSWPPLHGAGAYGDAETFRFLLERGADPTRKTKAGNALTAVACTPTLANPEYAPRHVELLALLLERGVDPNVTNDKRSPLACARQARRPEAVALLEAAGARDRETLRAHVKRALFTLGYLIGSH